MEPSLGFRLPCRVKQLYLFRHLACGYKHKFFLLKVEGETTDGEQPGAGRVAW
ncbi:hypothetical protein [Paenibacillus tundrae]|uniref:hypothetical protein n=1 Tax=Paenibacillus tundrae TaxID=528187 RepID=UPI0027D88A4D|nr:hypothetical protein [Paenibacillus tundrae]